MADLKFVGVNVEGTGLGPVAIKQRQANPLTDRLLVNTVSPTGGGSAPFAVVPISAVASSSPTITVSNGSNIVFSVQGDGLLSSLGTWINGTNLSYASALTIDPTGTPTYGANGSVSILIGSGVDPTTNGTDGGSNPPTGSLLLQTDGTAWIKTGIGTTSWIQLGSGGGGGGSRIQDADNDTYIDTDLGGLDSDIIVMGALTRVNVLSPELIGVGTGGGFALAASRALSLSSGYAAVPVEVTGDDLSINAGAGGDGNNVLGAGVGGAIDIQAGSGGLGDTVANGGLGGAITVRAGTGAAAGTLGGGGGGDLYLFSGAGGDDNGTGTLGGGVAGTLLLRAGKSGYDFVSGVVATGGALSMFAGGGSDSDVLASGGVGGTVTIAGGAGGAGTTAYGAGGAVNISGANSSLGGAGGAVAISGGNGGTEVSGIAGGFGGAITIAAGTGGAALAGGISAGFGGDLYLSSGVGGASATSNPGGSGGLLQVQAGQGGAGTAVSPAGAGGTVQVRGGNAGAYLGSGTPAGGNVIISGGDADGSGLVGNGGYVSINGGNGGTLGWVDIGTGVNNYGVYIGSTALTEIYNVSQGDIFFAARSSLDIPFNEAGQVNLTGFTATSIIGALNEVRAAIVTDHGALTGLADDDHTQYLLVNGTRNMSGRLVLIDGTAATPAIGFTSETNTGWYRSAAGTLGISILGASRGTITASLVSFDGAVQSASNGSFRGTLGGSGSPTFTFTSDTDTGMYQYNSNIVGIACGGNASYRLADGTLTFRTNQLLTTTGTLSLTSTGAMSLDAGATDITFDARSMVTPITLNEAGDTDLDASFTATSIVGALNELKAGVSDRFTLNAATTVAVGNVVIVNGAGTVDLADADLGDQFVAGIAISGATLGNPLTVQTSGLVSGLSGLTAGSRYYLDTTAGAMTTAIPTGSGDLVIELGFAISATQFVLRIQEGYVIP